MNHWQWDQDDFDLNVFSGRFHVNGRVFPYDAMEDDEDAIYLGIEVEHEIARLGQDPFLDTTRFSSALSWVYRWKGGRNRDGWNDALDRSSLIYSYGDRNDRESVDLPQLRNPTFDRDGSAWTLGFVHTAFPLHADELLDTLGNGYNFYRDEWLTYQVGFRMQGERTDGQEFQRKGYSIDLGFNLPLPYCLVFEARSEFTWADYDHPSIFEPSEDDRFDFIQRHGLFFRRGLYFHETRSFDAFIRFGARLSEANSNVDVYEYDRAVYLVEFILELGPRKDHSVNSPVPGTGYSSDPPPPPTESTGMLPPP